MTRELDALVAEKIMGWAWAVTKENGIVPFRRLVDPDIDYSRILDALLPDDKSIRILDRGYPHYSTSIADAWMVVEKITNMQIPKHVGQTMLHRLRQCGGRGWGVIWCSDFGYTEEVFGKTPELAICLAALKAVGHDI